MKNKLSETDEFIKIRNIAEESMKNMLFDADDISAEDLKKLLHELRVHQIELELQNEELRQAQLALDESREKYFDLYNLSPIGYVSINKKGIIIEANLTSARLLEIERQKLINSPFSKFILKEDEDIYYLNNRKLEETGNKQHFEIRLLKNKIQSFWTDVQIVQTKLASGELISLLAFNDLTANREFLKKSLHESEERFAKIFQSNPAALSISKLNDGMFVDVNENFIKLFGYERDELIGIKASELNLYNKESERNKIVQLIREKGRINNYKVTSKNKKGKSIVLLISDEIINLNGQEHILFSTIDFTEQSKLEEDLIKSRQQWRDTFDQIPDLIAIIDKEHKIVRANKPMLKKLGCSVEEARGKYCFECVHGTDSPISICPHSMMLKDGKEHVVELFEERLGGDYLVSCTPILDKDGKLRGSVHVARDISERKKIEKELKEAYDKLQIALDNADIGIWEWNLKTNELIWDKRTEKMFGYKEGTFGKTFTEFEKLLNEEDIPHLHNALQTAINDNTPFETIYRIKTPEGFLKYINAKGLVYIDKGKNPIKMSGVCVDITEMKEGSEEALFKLNEELLRSNKELAQFAYIASHDLQEPLRTVTLYTQLLEKRFIEKIDDDGKDFINFIVEGAVRMRTLIEDLLKYSRVNTHNHVLSDVDMNKVVELVKADLTDPYTKKPTVKITMKNLPVMKADESQMLQLIQNLVSNSIKFCTSEPKIHISGTENKNEWKISVRDNGIGIKEEYKERIFQIFQRLHTREEYPGTGIGLAICKRIIERHEGKIWLESKKEGAGTTIKFTIPKNKSIFN